MQYNQFIENVQKKTGINSRDEAVAVTRAVLETLGERLDQRTRNGLVAEVPNELKVYLEARGNHPDSYATDPDHYTLTEFYKRVGARANLTYYDAAQRTWQVMSVLQQAIPSGERDEIINSLPEEFCELFGEHEPNRETPRP